MGRTEKVCAHVFKTGKNVLRHKAVLWHSWAWKLWASSQALPGRLTHPKADQLIRKENMRTAVRGLGGARGTGALLAAERPKWDYLGGSDPAQLKRGSLKLSIKPKGKRKLRRYQPVMDGWWICGRDAYSLTNSNKLGLFFFVVVVAFSEGC